MLTPHFVSEDDKTRQAIRESFGQAAGIQRVLRSQEREEARGQASSGVSARAFLSDHLRKFLSALSAWQEEQGRKRGPRHVLLQFIARTDVETVAYIAFKTALDGALARSNRTLVARQIARRILQEERFRILRDHAPALFAYKMSNFHCTNYAFMAASLDHSAEVALDHEGKKAQLPVEPAEGAQIAAGVFLIDMLMFVYPDMFRLVRTVGRRAGRAPYVMMLTSETQTWLLARGEHIGLCQPVNTPMVIPPMQWEPRKRGGYRYAMKGRYPLLRSQYSRQRELEDMPTVYGALNQLQATAWKVNPHIYEVVRELLSDERPEWSRELGWFDLELPRKPDDISDNEVSRRRWRKTAHQTKKENFRRRSLRILALATLEVANGLLDEAAFFFPYSLDFRGRIYPIAEMFHPQGDDLARSLLLFSEGKPLDEAGARWLAIHGANCLGEREGWKASTATMNERVQWIHDHSAQIEQAGEDPFTHRWWLEADEPFQFLAFCIEWMSFIRANASGQDYACSLPVSMDGSCNGLQHFSAMFRDKVGAEAVNVVPQERPQDIYQRVADRVVVALETQLDNPVATRLLTAGLVTRKLCKRPTMTFGYGSKRFGFNRQIVQFFHEQDWPTIRNLLTFEDAAGKTRLHVKDAASLLAKLIWDALGDEVEKAQEGMHWMQACARAIVAAGKTVQWKAPSGLLVQQEYFKMRDHMTEIRTVALGRIDVRFQTHTHQPNPIRQANAISPNVVHSLDASVLMLTVLEAANAGLTSFAMVHDSYGTIPTDCAQLAQITRQTFARFYTGDVVDDLYTQFLTQSPDCPTPPVKGTLEVQQVEQSEYFFA